jgi:succinyl-diaminopimelate desuccinylase
LFAFIDCAENLKYPVALQLLTDEEIGGFDGTKFQVESGVNAEFVIATEPTNLDIVVKAK